MALGLDGIGYGYGGKYVSSRASSADDYSQFIVHTLLNKHTNCKISNFIPYNLILGGLFSIILQHLFAEGHEDEFFGNNDMDFLLE